MCMSSFRTWWLKTAKTYAFIVEAWSQNHGMGGVGSSWRFWGESVPRHSSLPASRGCLHSWHSLACTRLTSAYASILTVCLCLLSHLSLTRHLWWYLGPIQGSDALHNKDPRLVKSVPVIFTPSQGLGSKYIFFEGPPFSPLYLSSLIWWYRKPMNDVL